MNKSLFTFFIRGPLSFEEKFIHTAPPHYYWSTHIVLGFFHSSLFSCQSLKNLSKSFPLGYVFLFFAYSLPICRANLCVRRIRIPFSSKGLTRQIYGDKNYINLFFPQGRKSAKPTTKRLAKGTNNDHS